MNGMIKIWKRNICSIWWLGWVLSDIDLGILGIPFLKIWSFLLALKANANDFFHSYVRLNEFGELIQETLLFPQIFQIFFKVTTWSARPWFQCSLLQCCQFSGCTREYYEFFKIIWTVILFIWHSLFGVHIEKNSLRLNWLQTPLWLKMYLILMMMPVERYGTKYWMNKRKKFYELHEEVW